MADQSVVPLLLLLRLCPGVAEGDGAVEDRGGGAAVVAVGGEIADAFELDGLFGPGGGGERGFDRVPNGLIGQSPPHENLQTTIDDISK